ncbi:AbrB family transcriptional regulator [Halalkalibacter oceani]|uniref:AbrB family transcriptional regulator n=1 Tax=Halalkalibacter oceani TaxID=1653776 RepID=A0A9X2IN95_9BACI|nr:AbrB family transcriptional regulator [Halalkalibacter oceani]MCM3713885.1 AbrB family transcriptional regulator [Halalkalibacter oceani]
MNATGIRLTETLLIGFLGGLVFSSLHLPLPWMMGALVFVMVWQGVTKREAHWPSTLRDSGLVVLGIYFGLYFTAETFLSVGPYFLPYLVVTIVLISASIFISTLVTHWIDVDKMTSVFGSIPGGLSEMVIASESVHARSSLVAIFQTVRLVTVLFVVPTSILFYFTERGAANTVTPFQAFTFEGWTYLWFALPIVAGIWLRDRIPAGIVIGALVVTATLNISPVELAAMPPQLLMAAQLAVGIGIGKNISFADLKIGGKYCFVYFITSLLLILVSFGLGATLAYFTPLTLPTALLSIAPGGLVEMALTASAVGGDPAVVSAFQLTRIVVIILFVPPFLKWYFSSKQEAEQRMTN